MRAFRRMIPVIAALAVIATLSPAAAFQAQPITLDDNAAPGTPGVESVGNITHVANIPFPIQGSNGGGSDVEFQTMEVTKLSNGATGDPVCATDAEGSCLTDENGNTIFETEERDFAFAGRLTANGYVIDITDPANPVKVGEIPCPVYQNDIQVRGNILLAGLDSGGRCVKPDGQNTSSFLGSGIVDISDPRNPEYVGRIVSGRGSHNHTLHPTEPLVYISDSDLVGSGVIPIYDISDPASPTLVQTFALFAQHSPHDVTFNADGTRAYAASVSHTDILNTENPREPSVISHIYNEGISISHQADPTPDGNYLLVGDELGGGSVPGASPGGPVHVYDIRDEAHPVKLGVWGNDCVVVACDDNGAVHVTTAHVFRINPDGTTLAIAWYQDGVHVVDFSDIRGLNAAGSGAATKVGPRVIASMKMPNANTWSAKMWQERHPGYVFANDINRGFDIFYVPELDSGFVGFGSIRAATPAPYVAGAGVTWTDFTSNCEYMPVTNGVDSWVQEIPAEYADGSHKLSADVEGGVLYDLDMYFFDKNCAQVGASEETGGNVPEVGNIPEGAKYVLVANFLGDSGNLKIVLRASAA